MSVLVTGGAGYIGSHTVLRLRDAGEDVVVIDNLSTGHRSLVPDDVPFVAGELGDTELVRSVLREHRVKDIMHFAGSIVVPESVKDPLKYYLNNTSVSRSLIELALEEDAHRFVFSSTAVVYRSCDDGPLPEDAATEPVSPYGTSKLMTELMLRDVSAVTPLRFGVLRYFNVAGADPAGRSGQSAANATHLIKLACKAVLGQRDRLDVFGTDYNTADGTCVRDYVHVSDLADAHALVLDHLRSGGSSVTLNCGYGRGSSVREVVAAVKEVSGVDFEVRETARRPGDPATLVADVSRLKGLLPWTPRHDDLRDIIASALEWERKLADGAVAA